MQFYLTSKYPFKYLYLCLKNFFSFFFYYDYELCEFSIKKKYNEIIISWGKINDFNGQGNFFDRYCGKILKNKKILWIVQYEDLILPKKVSQKCNFVQKSDKKILHF